MHGEQFTARVITSNIYFLLYLLFTNIVISPFLMAFDKNQAQKQRFRVPEYVFFILSWLGGGIGILVAANLLRHKVWKVTFHLPVILTTLLLIFLLETLFR
jgi:uncharacterized membrane protein YsdA (DUF1294 family)